MTEQACPTVPPRPPWHAVNGMYGTHLINVARLRQIQHHGYDAGMDDTYLRGELAAAAMFYAMPEDHELAALARTFWPASWVAPKYSDEDQQLRIDDPREFRIRELAKAGALIAAEIDRLKRKDAV